MKTQIKSVTILTEAKNKTYTVGETYNGLVLHHIKDCSKYFEDSTHVEYVGFSADKNSICRIFSIINAPIAVQYEAVTEEGS